MNQYHLHQSTLLSYFSNTNLKDADTIVLHLADAALLRPKSLFLTIKNASERQLNLAEDCQHHGLFAHVKSFSFDAPVEHGLNSKKFTLVRAPRGTSRPEKAVLDAHLTVHIPHFLEIRDAGQIRHVPLVKFILDRRRYRTESLFEKVYGAPLRELH